MFKQFISNVNRQLLFVFNQSKIDRYKKYILLFAFFIISIASAKAQNDYYWVGGTGNWSDLTHWSTTSGGAANASTIPGSSDNVIFDANSFTATGQTVTLNIATPTCNDITWTSITNTPAFNGNGKTLNVYGSLVLSSAMTTNNLSVNFYATTTGKIVTSGGRTVNVFNFLGIGGGWTLQDNLTASSVGLINGSLNTNGKTVNAGRISCSNSNVRSLTLGTSVLNLSADDQAWDGETTTNFTFSGGSSTINFTGSSNNGQTMYCNGTAQTMPFNILNFTGASAGIYIGGFSANTVTFSGNCPAFNGANTVGTLTVGGLWQQNGNGNPRANTITTATIGGNINLSTANTYGTLNLTGVGSTCSFPSGQTQTIGVLNVTSGNCGSSTNIKGSSVGTRATLSVASGNVTMSYVSLKDIAVTGGATFTANNAIDLGNNNGWTAINGIAPSNYYWVGGTGNWSDGTHWATTSGGAGSGCAPSSVDNVIFDANSFTATGQTVTLNIATPTCNDITWTSITNTPAFNGNGKTLNVYGSLVLSSAMTTNNLSVNFYATTTGKIVTSGGRTVNVFNFLGIGGGWTLQDNLTASSVGLINGSLNTNGKTVNAGRISCSNSNVRSLTLGTSVLNLSADDQAWDGETTTNFTFSGGSSTINFTGSSNNGQTMYCNGTAQTMPFNILNFTGASAGIYIGGFSANTVTFSGNCPAFNGANTVGTLTVGGLWQQNGNGNPRANTITTATIGGNINLFTANTFGDLTLYPGSTITFPSGAIQTINGTLSATGTGSYPITIKSSTTSSVATISKTSGTVCLDYVRLQDITASGGATFDAGINSTIIARVTGFVFNGACTLPPTATYLWNGFTSTNWSTNTNWSPNIVPLATNNVLISKTTNQPIISAATSAVVNNLTINSGASLTISGILTPSGTITNTGTLTVAPGGALVGSSSNVNGEVTVQASVVGQRGWRVFGNPFSSNLDIATVANTNGITIGTTVPASGVTDSRTYNIATGLWSNVASPTTSWTNGSLYALFIRGLSSQVTGSTYTSNPSAFTYKVSGTLSNPSLGRNQSSGVFRVIGNPYAAPINTSALTAQTTDVPYYTYKISATGTPRVKSGSWVAASSNSSATTTIPVMGVLCYMPTSSALFNVTTSDINTTGAVQTGLFGSESSIQQLEINVNNGKDFADKLFIRTNVNATNNGKDRSDLPKYENESTNFYTIAPDNAHLAVDARKEWNQNIPLGIRSAAGNYSIAVENNSLQSGIVVYLKDKLLNVNTELKAGAQYDFTITSDPSTLGEKRFELFFGKPGTGIATAEESTTGLQMKILGNVVNGNVLSIQVSGIKSSEIASLALVDMDGRVVATKSVVNGINNINISNVSKGMQLIKISNGIQQLTKKFIKF